MTPPDHFLMGVSLANIVYSVQGILNKKIFKYKGILFLLGIMAMSPDLDSFRGNYTSKDPLVGHRGISHSFLGVALISLAVIIFLSLVSFLYRYYKSKRSSDHNTGEYLYEPLKPGRLGLYFLLCFLSGSTHLISDLPQPLSIWKGIPLFFPLRENGIFLRNGGWSKIGWYDYNILWYLIGAAIISLLIILAVRVMQKKGYKRLIIPSFLFIVVLNLGVFIWISNYVKNCNYKNSGQWNKYQYKVLKSYPSAITSITLKGRKIFLELFSKVTK